MPFTGEVIHGWRIARMTDGRRPMHGTGVAAWVDEPVIELVKGHRHIRAKGQAGIDPEIVLGRALHAALVDDHREAWERQEFEDADRIADALLLHERIREIRENGWAARRVNAKAARMKINAATSSAKGS
jgi:hypothetical protein